MPKRLKKPEAEPADITIDKTETLAKAAIDVAEAHVEAGGSAQGALVRMSEHVACPICGRHKTTDVCEVDGHRFEVKS